MEPKKDNKSLLAQIKALLFSTTEKFSDYKLNDGTMISADKVEVGGSVTINGVAAAAGDYVLEDGSTITVDASGVITAVKPKEEPVDDLTTTEGMRKAYNKFETGTPEERIANLETLCKALMEYSFGWQLREAAAKQTTDEAIRVYKTLTDKNVTAVANQQKMMSQVVELLEGVMNLTPEQAPAPAKRKFSFSQQEDKGKSLDKFKAAALKLSQEWKENERQLKVV